MTHDCEIPTDGKGSLWVDLDIFSLKTHMAVLDGKRPLTVIVVMNVVQ